MNGGARARVYWAVGVAVCLVLVIGLATVWRIDPRKDDSSMGPVLPGAPETVTLPKGTGRCGTELPAQDA